MGTRVAGMGTDARQISACASGSGINTGTGLSTTPSATENARLDGEGAESSCSDAAQQRSASAWLTTRLDPSPSESALCIGHAPSEQHAMRASGVAIQPAQTPSCPAETADTTTSTARRRQRSSTLLRMLDHREPVKQYNSVAPGRKEAAGAIPREKWQVRPWTREECPRPGEFCNIPIRRCEGSKSTAFDRPVVPMVLRHRQAGSALERKARRSSQPCTWR